MDYFPPDVRFRYDGDKPEAVQDLMGLAKLLLHKALLQQRGRMHVPVQLTEYLDGGGYVSVFLLDSQKIVTIVPPNVPKVEKETEKESAFSTLIYVLCGTIKKGETVTVAGKEYLRAFRPTLPTSISHRIVNQFHDSLRLANTGYQTKPCAYSGIMKRVVAAVLGLGRIKDASGQYLTHEPVTRTVLNKYLSTATSTHGVIKTGTRNHWLIEISAQNGVLAMPLPLINSTRSPGYLKYLRRIGDTGGARIVNEFGGLPSGETFPTGSALTTAITNKKVLRLLTKEDLDGYYGNTGSVGNTHWCSWAFSETGSVAHNTKFTFKLNNGDTKYSINGQHWGISITLTPHNRGAVFPVPVGVGSATLSLYDEGKISKHGAKTLWAGGSYLTPVLVNYINAINIEDLDPAEGMSDWNPIKNEWMSNPPGDPGADWGCPVYVFFRGDQLEIVKWVPPYVWEHWFSASRTSVVAGGDQNRGPFYTGALESGIKASPGAFITSTMDLRKLNIEQSQGSGGPIRATYNQNGLAYAEYYRYPPVDSSYTETGDPETAQPTVFQATPTTMHLPVYGIGSRIDQYEVYYCLSAEELSWNTTLHSAGVGGYDGRPRSICRVWAMVPGFCREGIVLCRSYFSRAEGATETVAYGIFTDAGYLTIPIDDRYGKDMITGIPDPKYRMFFAASVNTGPTKAYVMTKKVAWQPERYSQPVVDPGYTYYGTLPETSTDSPTAEEITFIGSY